MKTYYDPRRTYFHNIRFSYEEDKRLRKLMKECGFSSVSDFIRAAVLDKRLTQSQVVEIEPYKIDNNRLIPQVHV